MYLGRKQLGQEVSFSVASAGGDSEIPSWPSLPPTLDIWKGTTLVLSGLKMPKIDGAVVGLFQLAVYLDERFSTGYYQGVSRWLRGTYSAVQIDDFRILDGGNPDGAVIAMFHHEMPQARFIVMQTDAGKIQRGKNPSA
jgi:hypothetical protein